MNPSLLAVDIVVPGAPGVCPVSPKSAATGNVKQSLIASSDSPILSGSSQPTQFDKVLAVAKLHSSDGALSGEAAPPVSQENQDKPELAAEDCNFLTVQAAGLAQLAAPVASLAAPVSAFAESTGGEDVAAKVPQGEAQPQNKPAPLINMLPDSKLSLAALPTPGLNVTPALASQEAAGGLIPLALKSEDKPLSTPPNQPVTSDVTVDTEQVMGKNLETTNLFNKTPIGKAYLTIGENPPGAERLDAPAPVFRQEAAEVSARPPIRQDVFAGLPGVRTEKAPALPALASQKAAGAVSNGQKIPWFAPLVPPAGIPAQTVSANPEESAFAPRKPIDNRTTVGHKTPILSESAGSGSKKSINNLLSDSASQKLNVAEIQITVHQAKEPTLLASEVNPNLQQILSDNNAQILSQRSPSSAQTGNTANPANISDAAVSIRKQILESIHSSLSGGDRQISIRLNPPELGKVFIRFQEHDAQITGLLEVSQTQTRYQIEQALPQIIRDLQDSGIQVKRLEVVLTEQTDYHASQDQSLQNGWSGQHGSAESGTPGGNKSADVWLTNNDGYQDGLLRQVQITDGSINVLV